MPCKRTVRNELFKSELTKDSWSKIIGLWLLPVWYEVKGFPDRLLMILVAATPAWSPAWYANLGSLTLVQSPTPYTLLKPSTCKCLFTFRAPFSARDAPEIRTQIKHKQWERDDEKWAYMLYDVIWRHVTKNQQIIEWTFCMSFIKHFQRLATVHKYAILTRVWKTTCF